MSAKRYSPKPPVRTWIGFDADADPPLVCCKQGRKLDVSQLQAETCDTIVKSLKAGDRCLALLPSRYCLYRLLTPPDVGHRRIERLLPGLLDIELPFPIEQCETRFVLYKTPEVSRQALALSVRHSDIDARLESLRDKGCNPSVLLPEPWVAWTYARATFNKLPASSLNVIGIQRNAETTFVIGKSQRMLACTTGPSPHRESLLHVLLQAHDPEGNTPIALLHVNLDPGYQSQPPPIPLSVQSRLRILQPDEPTTWMARALADCGLSAALPMNLRRCRRLHPGTERVLQRRPGQLAAVLTAAAVITVGTHFHIVRQYENQAAQARKALLEAINTLAGYSINQRGQDAIDAVAVALEERILPEIEAMALPAVPESLQLILKYAAAEDITIHKLVYSEPDWSIHASAPNPASAQVLADNLSRFDRPFSLALAANASANRSSVEFTLKSRREP